MAPPIPQPKNSNPTGWIRKSPCTLKREAFERRKAAYEAQLEYEATVKMNPARKKLNAKPGLKKASCRKNQEKGCKCCICNKENNEDCKCCICDKENDKEEAAVTYGNE